MEIDISRSTTVRAMTMAGTTSVINIRLTAVSIMRGSAGGMAEVSTTMMSGSTTIAVVASVMGVTAVVEVKMRLSDRSVASEVTTEAIAEVRARLASVGAALVVADITVKSWGMELRSGSVTTIAEAASVMGVTAVVEVKMRLSDGTVAGVGATKAIAGTRVAKLNTVERVLLLLTVNGSLLDCTTETMIMLLRSAEAVSRRSTNVEAALARCADAQTRSAVTSVVRTRGLGKRAVRSLGSVERSVATVRVRSTITMRSPFSSGGSSNNSSESESLEHLTIKYIESLLRGFF